MRNAVVIGAGPAGLMAAEILADAGVQVTLVDANPSVGRKLLMAGKSGLNLTKDEPLNAFISRFEEAADWLGPALNSFSNQDVRNWAVALGQDLFTGSSRRVFPRAMKASPLLRAWLGRLRKKPVLIRTRWRWTGWQEGALTFETSDGVKCETPDVTVLALGGASWSRLGSNGAWADILTAKNVPLSPFKPANMGFEVDWSAHMQPHFGKPVKSCALVAAGKRVRGEFVISSYGLEGGAIYELSRLLRDGASLTLDLVPDLSMAKVRARLSQPRGKRSLANHLRHVLKIGPAKRALLNEFADRDARDPESLAQALKNLAVPLGKPRPLDQAISTAGGVMREALDDALMLRALPGVFCAGEMLDWEAPTGGYLLSACLATGRWAALGAATYVGARPGDDTPPEINSKSEES